VSVARPRVCDARGSVTAETALAIPALVLVTVTLMGGVVLAGQQVRCRDAASAVARAVARGESSDAVAGLVARTAPASASIDVSSDGSFVRVRVAWRSTGGGWRRVLPEVSAQAVAQDER
jgi:hypothetical protein